MKRMEYQTLEMTIQYAEDLNKVNFISKMDVYVVVSISGGGESSKQRIKTPVNHGGDADPTWRFPMLFTVEEAALLQNRLVLDFEIKCERALGDRLIGEVHVPVKELLDFPASHRGGATSAAAKNFVSYQVTKPGGRPKGKLTFSYQFRGKSAVSPAPPPAPSEAHGGSTIAYPVVEPVSQYLLMEEMYVGPTSPYPPPALGIYPPPVAVSEEVWGGQIQYPPAPAPQGYFGHSQPVMQLAPDWWIVDWRYDARCTGF